MNSDSGLSLALAQGAPFKLAADVEKRNRGNAAQKEKLYESITRVTE